MKKLSNKLQTLLNKMRQIPQDKLVHFFYGTMLYSLVSFFSSESTGFFVTVLVALTIELWQFGQLKTDVSEYDINQYFKDFIYTCLFPAIDFILL